MERGAGVAVAGLRLARLCAGSRPLQLGVGLVISVGLKEGEPEWGGGEDDEGAVRGGARAVPWGWWIGGGRNAPRVETGSGAGLERGGEVRGGRPWLGEAGRKEEAEGACVCEGEGGGGGDRTGRYPHAEVVPPPPPGLAPDSLRE